MDDRDRRRWLGRLDRARTDCQVRIYLYCLMTNHVHLLLETPRANLSQFMHKLETAYTVYFNRRHDRVGHLLQGRFKAQPVQGDEYLLKLSRYIHLNPTCVDALREAPIEERAKALRAYRWSSYREYIGLEAPSGLVETGPLWRLVSGRSSDPAQEYARYVEAGLARSDEEFHRLMRAPAYGIGDEAFRACMAHLYRKRQELAGCLEDVAFRRVQRGHSAAEVLGVVAEVFAIPLGELTRRRRRCPARGVAAHMLARHAGLNQREIARLLGMGTGAAVSQQLRGVERALEADEDLRGLERRVAEALSDQSETMNPTGS